MSRGRRVLVIGKGGREHALAERLLLSESVSEVVVAPGNPGTSAPPAGAAGKSLRNAAGAPLDVATALRPDLVVVGPEAPLCDGIVDELSAAGFLVYGPTRAAARLEGSKAFLKEFANQHGINTARHHTVRSEAELTRALAEFSSPPVVKADGLCAGKGVVVAESHDEALHAAREMLSGRAFGAAGHTVVLEQRLRGTEVSAHAICDGSRGLLLPFVQDHKRLSDGDRGPNTGGMGTYGPVSMPDARLSEYIQRSIVDRVLNGMARAGTPFRGTIFAGLMLEPGADPSLIEINARFGDPETQVLTNILEGDFCELLVAAARGSLSASAPVSLPGDRHALCVTLAAPGYPTDPRLGQPIRGLAQAASLDGVRVYHAGTVAGPAGDVLTAGGRVLSVTGVGQTLADAHERAYRAAASIDFDGKQLRRDIAHAAFGR